MGKEIRTEGDVKEALMPPVFLNPNESTSCRCNVFHHLKEKKSKMHSSVLFNYLWQYIAYLKFLDCGHLT